MSCQFFQLAMCHGLQSLCGAKSSRKHARCATSLLKDESQRQASGGGNPASRSCPKQACRGLKTLKALKKLWGCSLDSSLLIVPEIVLQKAKLRNLARSLAHQGRTFRLLRARHCPSLRRNARAPAKVRPCVRQSGEARQGTHRLISRMEWPQKLWHMVHSNASLGFNAKAQAP